MRRCWNLGGNGTLNVTIANGTVKVLISTVELPLVLGLNSQTLPSHISLNETEFQKFYLKFAELAHQTCKNSTDYFYEERFENGSTMTYRVYNDIKFGRGLEICRNGDTSESVFLNPEQVGHLQRYFGYIMSHFEMLQQELPNVEEMFIAIEEYLFSFKHIDFRDDGQMEQTLQFVADWGLYSEIIKIFNKRLEEYNLETHLNAWNIYTSCIGNVPALKAHMGIGSVDDIIVE